MAVGDLLTQESIFVGGWFGQDGQSEPINDVFVDGWYEIASGVLADLEARLKHIEDTLRANEPIYINNNGDYEELVI